jgi:hypothetical protein
MGFVYIQVRFFNPTTITSCPLPPHSIFTILPFQILELGPLISWKLKKPQTIVATMIII